MLPMLKSATPEALASIAEEMRVRKTTEVFLLASMGSQFSHHIYRKVTKFGVYCLAMDPATVTAEDIAKVGPTGIIVSGGPASVHSEPPPFDRNIFDLGIPTLGICLGFQMWAQHVGASVVPATKREYQVTKLCVTNGSNHLLRGCEKLTSVLQSHGDEIDIDGLPFLISASTENCHVAAASFDHLHGVQFHPEVEDTKEGDRMFENFLFRICGAKDRFPAQSEAHSKISSLRNTIGDKRVLLMVSGGCDSSVTAHLLKEACPGGRDQLFGLYIKGIDRPDDEEFALRHFGNQPWIKLITVDATDDFLQSFKGIELMKLKRKSMKGVYHAHAERVIAEIGNVGYVSQGTLYTDIRESGHGDSGGARVAGIKEHHNVGLPWSVQELIPLADCMKDSARAIGREIGVPHELLYRHPFPGPGMTIRMEGEVTREKLRITRESDGIYIEELRRWNLYDSVWQAGAVLTSSIHTMAVGDDARSGPVVCCWGVYSLDGFTARPARYPHDFMELVADRITNEVRGAGPVMFRFSGKPPATIEWG